MKQEWKAIMEAKVYIHTHKGRLIHIIALHPTNNEILFKWNAKKDAEPDQSIKLHIDYERKDDFLQLMNVIKMGYMWDSLK